MNVLLQLLFVVVLLQHPAAIAGQFTAAPPTCLADTITFRCDVSGDNTMVTTWRVNGSSECPLVHSSSSVTSTCGPGNAFTATAETGFGTSATLFSSTLSVTATPELDGTLVECFGPGTLGGDLGNRVGDSVVHVLGPPSYSLSCIDLSEDTNGALAVTVSWTLSGGDGADFFFINITTNDPTPPYGGLLNISNASVTQRELTEFQTGYEYNITVRGVNCESQEGNESEPLTITPQVPDTPASCNVSVVYNQSSGMLLAIDSVWDPVLNQDLGTACPGSSGNTTQYQLTFQTTSSVDPENVNASRCTNGKCEHTFQPFMNVPSSYDNVSVAAGNVVGVGAAATCTTQLINITNNLLLGEVIDVSSPVNATLNCTFLSGFTGSAHCRVQYGTDPTYMNLPCSAESNESGTAGESVSVILREQLNSSTVYYFTVSAVSGDITVRVQAVSFTTPVYDCILPSLSEWHIALIVIGVAVLMVALVLLGVLIIGGSCYEKSTKKWWRKCFITATLVEFSGLLFIIGIPLWIVYDVASNDSCLLPGIKGWLMFQFVLDIIILAIVTPFIFVEILIFCREWKRQKGDRSEKIWLRKWLHVVYRLTVVVSCVLFWIGAVLWVIVGGTVALPGSGMYVASPLVTWQISCLTTGGALLVLAFVATITAYTGRQVYICKQLASQNAGNPKDKDKFHNLKWQQVLYLSLRMIAIIFCAIGVALWITVGVVVSNPPNDNMCDLCWRGPRDGLVISGFAFSILALIYAIAVMILFWVVHQVEDEPPPPGKCIICYTVMVVLLYLSVIGIPLVIMVCCKTEQGATCSKVGKIVLLCLSVIGFPLVILEWYKTEKGDTEGTAEGAGKQGQQNPIQATGESHELKGVNGNKEGEGGGGDGGNGQLQCGKQPCTCKYCSCCCSQGTQGASRPNTNAPRYMPSQKEEEEEEGKG